FIVAATKPSTTSVWQSRISAPLSLTDGPTIKRLSPCCSPRVASRSAEVAALLYTLAPVAPPLRVCTPCWAPTGCTVRAAALSEALGNRFGLLNMSDSLRLVLEMKQH